MSRPQGKHQKPLSGKYVNLLLNIAYSIFKAAIEEELIDANPVASVRRPKVEKKRRRILEPAEIPRAYKAFSDDRARRVVFSQDDRRAGKEVVASGRIFTVPSGKTPEKSATAAAEAPRRFGRGLLRSSGAAAATGSRFDTGCYGKTRMAGSCRGGMIEVPPQD